MLGNISLSVSDLPRSIRFYDAALSALGYGRVWSVPDAVGYGVVEGGVSRPARLTRFTSAGVGQHDLGPGQPDHHRFSDRTGAEPAQRDGTEAGGGKVVDGEYLIAGEQIIH